MPATRVMDIKWVTSVSTFWSLLIFLDVDLTSIISCLERKLGFHISDQTHIWAISSAVWHSDSDGKVQKHAAVSAEKKP